jgi:hypothetical protein
MTKDRFWFEHDSNAHDNPKILDLRMQIGWCAYGAFWAIVELLRDAEGYTIELSRLGGICFNLRIERDWVETMFSIGLLERDDERFWSSTLQGRMEKWDEKKRIRAEAGRKGGIAKGRNSNINSNAKAKLKQTKSKAKANEKQMPSGALARTEQNRTEQDSIEAYIYKKSKVENEQDEIRQPNSSSIKTSKVNLQPLDEALEFLPKLEDRNLARFILTVWSDCTTADAIAWVQQAKPYLLQLDGDHMRWLEDISTSKSPNDPVYDINGRNRLHQWLMNCLKNTVKKQKHAASKTGGKVEQQLEKLGRLRNERIRREAEANGDNGHRGEDVCADDGGISGADRVF